MVQSTCQNQSVFHTNCEVSGSGLLLNNTQFLLQCHRKTFLRPPMPLVQSNRGLKAPERNEIKSAKFPSLFANIAIATKKVLPRSALAFKILPYDFYCPLVQTSLIDCICKKLQHLFCKQSHAEKAFCCSQGSQDIAV